MVLTWCVVTWLRHKQSWEVVNAYVQRFLKVWGVKPEQTVLPTILPWIDGCFEDMTYARAIQEEGVVVWVNLTTAGILSAMKKAFIASFITGLLTSMAGNSIALVIHANRASDAKTGSDPQVIHSIKTRSIKTCSHFCSFYFQDWNFKLQGKKVEERRKG